MILYCLTTGVAVAVGREVGVGNCVAVIEAVGDGDGAGAVSVGVAWVAAIVGVTDGNGGLAPVGAPALQAASQKETAGMSITPERDISVLAPLDVRGRIGYACARPSWVARLRIPALVFVA